MAGRRRGRALLPRALGLSAPLAVAGLAAGAYAAYRLAGGLGLFGTHAATATTTATTTTTATETADRAAAPPSAEMPAEAAAASDEEAGAAETTAPAMTSSGTPDRVTPDRVTLARLGPPSTVELNPPRQAAADTASEPDPRPASSRPMPTPPAATPDAPPAAPPAAPLATPPAAPPATPPATRSAQGPAAFAATPGTPTSSTSGSPIPVTWMQDDHADSCVVCSARFGLVTRRHHCRFCGVVICSRCSKARVHHPEHQAKVRCCTTCVAAITTRRNEQALRPSPSPSSSPSEVSMTRGGEADLDASSLSVHSWSGKPEAALLARMQVLREADLEADDTAREEWVALLTALDAVGIAKKTSANANARAAADAAPAAPGGTTATASASLAPSGRGVEAGVPPGVPGRGTAAPVDTPPTPPTPLPEPAHPPPPNAAGPRPDEFDVPPAADTPAGPTSEPPSPGPLETVDALYSEREHEKCVALLSSALSGATTCVAAMRPSRVALLWRLGRAWCGLGKLAVDNVEVRREHLTKAMAILVDAERLGAAGCKVDPAACGGDPAAAAQAAVMTEAMLHKWLAILSVWHLGHCNGNRAKLIENAKHFLQHLEVAIRLAPRDPSLRYMHGLLCATVAELSWFKRKLAAKVFGSKPLSKTWADALASFDKAAGLRPGGVVIPMDQLGIAESHIKLGHDAAAREALRRCVEASSTSTEDDTAHESARRIIDRY